MIRSLNRKTRALLLAALFAQTLFAQNSDFKVTRCSSVSRTAPIQNIFIAADNTRWVANDRSVSQVMGTDAGTPLALNPGEQTALAFHGGNADVRWTPEVLQMTLGDAPEISAAWYDERNDWLWLGTKESGLFQLKTKPALKLVEKFTASNSKLKSDAVTVIFQDRTGRYWIGTDNGLLVGTPGKWKSELDGYHVARVRQAGADIWALADGEFWLMPNGEKPQAVNVKLKALEGEVEDFDLSPAGSTLWILSRMVARYDLDTDDFEVFSGAELYTSEFGRRLSVDLDGAVWIGTDDKGLYLIDKTSSLLVSCVVDKELSCDGSGRDAALKVKIEGGKAPYRYDWSATGLAGENPQNVGAGAYTVTVTDSNGKSKSAKIRIDDPRLSVSVQQKLPESGPGKKDGSAEAAVKGGTAAYSFKWDSGETGPLAKKLGEGAHSLTVTDQKGCSSTASVTITQTLAALSASIAETTPIPCSGGNTLLKATVSGGKEPYQYEWSNPRLDGPQPSGVSAGTYTLTVVDAAGGKTVTSINLVQPAALSTIAVQQTPAATGKTDGKAVAQPRGGTGKYSYRWDNAETTERALQLAPGAHTVTVTDENGCTAQATVTITENILPLTARVEESEPVKCHGGQGALTVQVEGGKSPFQFQWSAPAFSGYQPSGVPAGTYSVTVTDAAGGRSVTGFTLKQPDPVSATATAQAPAATGASDGKALTKATGGTGAYQFRWDNGETADRAVKLAPGTHTVTVSDALGCSATASVTITENILPLAARIEEAEAVKCHGGQGALAVQVEGGKSPFQFQWSAPALSGEQPSGVPAGTYSVTVTDAAGGRSVTGFTLKQPAPVSATATVQAPAATGASDGKALAKATGGTGAYQFRWDNGETADRAVRLAPGTHTVTVTDAPGCSATASVEITENILPLGVRLVEVEKIKCQGGKTRLQPEVNGGKPPYQFQLNNAGLPEGQTPEVAAGTYQLAVTDATGKQMTATLVVREPEAIVAKAGITAPASAGNDDGKALAEARGGTGALSYAWDNGEKTPAAAKLAPGAHTVTVTDENGCRATVTLSVSENILPLEVDVVETGDIKCAGGVSGLKVNVRGGKPPFRYKWDNPAWTGAEAKNIPAATYAVLVTDAQGTTQSAVAIVNQPDSLLAEISRVVGATTERSADGKATVKIKGGTPPYSIAWNNGETTATAAKLNLGPHSVRVADANGCTLDKTFEVKQRILPELNAALLKSGQTIRMEQLRFEADSAALTPDALPTLDELYDFMEENGDVVIEIGGHTNSTPSDEFCDRLSTARAKSAAEYLLRKGINAKRVAYKGYGKRQPVASNATAEGRRKNQRVEIKILTLKRQ